MRPPENMSMLFAVLRLQKQLNLGVARWRAPRHWLVKEQLAHSSINHHRLAPHSDMLTSGDGARRGPDLERMFKRMHEAELAGPSYW